MFLNKVLEIITREGVSEIGEIARKTGLPREDVEFAVDYWRKKGKLKTSDNTGAADCCSGPKTPQCKFCVYYQPDKE
jgi:hypothetical protein